jgi:hypothetical protein
MTQILTPLVTANVTSASTVWTIVDLSSTYTQITAPGYLSAQQLLGHNFLPTDFIFIQYSGGNSLFSMSFIGSIITLAPQVGTIFTRGVTLDFASLASAGHLIIQPSSGSMQFKVRDIRVNYSAAGLSGGGGNRLISITDGTTIYNSTGITAALLGTPVNTLWNGSGNPLPGNVAMNASTAAGTSLYAIYTGGTTDYTAGSVSLTVILERSA